MSKKIASLGIELPHEDVVNIQFSNRDALMDYDIIIICFYVIVPIESIDYWRKEIENFLKQGKNIYFFLFPPSPTTYSILPFEFLGYELKNGKVVEKQQTSVLDEFYETYKDVFTYCMTYSQTNPESKIIFTGTDKTQVLGSILKHQSKSYCVLLPCLNIIRHFSNNFINYMHLNLDDSNIFIKIITDIDYKLSKGDKTPPPEWTQDIKYSSSIERETRNKIEEVEYTIQELEQEKKEFNNILHKEQEFKGLLFETGTPLENIVIESLEILGYEAKNFKNEKGDEIDIILQSPEGFIYCGECEGKDNKPIAIEKFRQLLDHINVYEEFLEDNTKNIYGILFGNACRLQDTNTRNENFTKACMERAKNKNIILVKTYDLYPIVQYLREHNDEEFKKSCRDIIHNSLGSIVKFPDIPSNK